MKLVRAFLLPFILFSAFNSFAQIDTAFLAHTITSLERYSSVNPVEKVHLHLDKTGYMPGDTIWFKVYTVAGANHGLSAIGNIIHVELLNTKDSVISRIALPLSSGVSWGDFALPVLIKTGSYHIRAYTNWMRNFSADYFFDQPVNVREAQISSISKNHKKAQDPDIQFFPEGGALINGLRSKIAIKVVSTEGKGEDVDGSVIDNDGTEVAVFSTQHLGMGVFALIPQSGKTYKAKITRKNGLQLTVNLPKAQDDGFAIAINNSQPDSISIRVASSAKLFEIKKGAKYYLLAQSGAKVYYTADFKLWAQSFITRIDKQRFPTGLVQFTLFADNGEPLNERIAFIQHNDQLRLRVSSAKETYAARQKVSIAIKGTDKDNKPVVGSFSASVVNQDLADTNNGLENTILSNLLLTADIKGYVEKPGYYFTNVNEKTQADLDLLMLTQGYHRFEWKQIIEKTYPSLTYEPENSISLMGFIKTNSDKPIANGKVMLYQTRGGWFKLDTVADENGRFTFKGLIPNPDTTLKYILQARTTTDKKNVQITLDTIAPFKNKKNTDGILEQASDTATLTAYQQQIKQQLKISLDKRTIQLKEVVIKETKAPLSWNIMPDQIIKIPKESTGETLSQYLSTRINGTIFKNGLPYSTRSNSVMNIVMDGMVIDPLYFQSLNLTEIEGVEVLRTSGRKDLLTNLGNVIILTRRKNYGGSNKQSTPDVITYRSNGLYKAREFYTPKYDGGGAAVRNPDLRTTIYWKPDIVTDKDGNATLTFFNPDIKGIYHVTIEGIDIEGNLGRQDYTYNVE